MKYKCVIAPVGFPTQEQEVIVEAENKALALIINCELRPGTYVKSIEELLNKE